MKIHELVEGVEYEWGNARNKIKIIDGDINYMCSDGNWAPWEIRHNEVNKDGFTECEFKPEDGEQFWFADFTMGKGINYGIWKDYESDLNIRERVGIYRTKEQAIEKARELGWVE